MDLGSFLGWLLLLALLALTLLCQNMRVEWWNFHRGTRELSTRTIDSLSQESGGAEAGSSMKMLRRAIEEQVAAASVVANKATQGCDVVMFTSLFIHKQGPRRGHSALIPNLGARCKRAWVEKSMNPKRREGELCCVLVTTPHTAKRITSYYNISGGLWPWHVVAIAPPSGSLDDHLHLLRAAKILSHRLFPSVSLTVYVDWNLELQQDPRYLVKNALVKRNASFVVWRQDCGTIFPEAHTGRWRREEVGGPFEPSLPKLFRGVSFRSVVRTAAARSAGAYWSKFELQLMRYKRLHNEGELTFEDFVDSDVILRDSSSPISREVSEVWWDEYTTDGFSDKDELSLSFAISALLRRHAQDGRCVEDIGFDEENGAGRSGAAPAKSSNSKAATVFSGLFEMLMMNQVSAKLRSQSSTSATPNKQWQKERRQLIWRRVKKECTDDQKKLLQTSLGFFFPSRLHRNATKSSCGDLMHWSFDPAVATANSNSQEANDIYSRAGSFLGIGSPSPKHKNSISEVMDGRWHHAVYEGESSLKSPRIDRLSTLNFSHEFAVATASRDMPALWINKLHTPTPSASPTESSISSADTAKYQLIREGAKYSIAISGAEASALMSHFRKEGDTEDEIELIIEFLVANRGAAVLRFPTSHPTARPTFPPTAQPSTPSASPSSAPSISKIPVPVPTAHGLTYRAWEH